MKILVDTNLSPEWTGVLKEQGRESVHWSEVGDPRAPDKEIMEWAKKQQYIVFTHDLDFGALLAATRGNSPSVMQIRTKDVNPHHIKDIVCQAFQEFENYLREGALITVDKNKMRARILPLNT